MKPDINSLPWKDLTDSAHGAVADLVVILAKRFTGTITLECTQGGVRLFNDARDRRSADIGAIAEEYLRRS